MNLNPIK